MFGLRGVGRRFGGRLTRQHGVLPWLEVVPIPMFSDNYAYSIRDSASCTQVLVDPADPDAILTYLATGPFSQDGRPDFEVTHILTTHHHADHSGGNEVLGAMFGGVEVVGGIGEEIPGRTLGVEVGGEVVVGNGAKVEVVGLGCHTRGHVGYYVLPVEGDGGGGWLFCGDAIFVGGVGKFFEGDAGDMWKVLETVRKLPEETQLYCGHEYTLSNYEFARKVDPDNKELQAVEEAARQKRESHLPTIPSTIAQEEATNPFFRTHRPEIAERVAALFRSHNPTATQPDPRDPIAILAAMRHLKDQGL